MGCHKTGAFKSERALHTAVAAIVKMVVSSESELPVQITARWMIVAGRGGRRGKKKGGFEANPPNRLTVLEMVYLSCVMILSAAPVSD